MKKFISVFLTVCLLSSNLCFKAREISNQSNSISEKTTQQLITKEKDSLPLKILKTSIKATKIVGSGLILTLEVFVSHRILKLLIDEILGDIPELSGVTNGPRYQETAGCTTYPSAVRCEEIIEDEMTDHTIAGYITYKYEKIEQKIHTSNLKKFFPNLTDLLKKKYTVYLPLGISNTGNMFLMDEKVLLVSDQKNRFFEVGVGNDNNKIIPIVQISEKYDYCGAYSLMRGVYSQSTAFLLKIDSSTNLNQDELTFKLYD